MGVGSIKHRWKLRYKIFSEETKIKIVDRRTKMKDSMINIQVTGDIERKLSSLVMPREGEVLRIGLRKFRVTHISYYFPLDEDDSCKVYTVVVREL